MRPRLLPWERLALCVVNHLMLACVIVGLLLLRCSTALEARIERRVERERLFADVEAWLQLQRFEWR